MFGAYHAGAWKALAPRFAPDAVVGASVGSLNGWMIAGGIESGQLIERWLSAQAAGKIAFHPPAHWRAGLLRVPYLEEWIREMHGHFTPRVPFGVVLTRLRPFGPVLARAPDVTWRHLASSCAVPALFPHYRLQGALYTDGGLVQALPLWAAAEFGCGRAIAIHCLPTLPFPGGRMASKLMRAVSRHDFSTAAEMSVLTIAPAEPLGGLRDFLRWKRDCIERCIERGFLDAEAAIAAHPEFFPGTASSAGARMLAERS